MPKIAYDFTREMIFYLIKCNDDSITDCYCGSTFEFARRKSSHKTGCCNKHGDNYNYKIYQTIRENGGWDNWTMTMVDRKIVKDKLEAKQYEQTLIDNHKANLNMIRAYTSKEQKQEQIIKQRAECYILNREQLLKQSTEYNASHKEEISKQKAEWYASNREQILKQSAEYRVSNREEINKKKRERYAK